MSRLGLGLLLGLKSVAVSVGVASGVLALSLWYYGVIRQSIPDSLAGFIRT
jgi:hypothetical protein